MKKNRIHRLIYDVAQTLFVVVCLQLLSALLCLAIGAGNQSDGFTTVCVIFCINGVLRIYRSILDIEDMLKEKLGDSNND